MPWEVRACDNMNPAAGLGSMPDRSVDVVITDPPTARRCMRAHAAASPAIGSKAASDARIGCASWVSRR
jgi:hypothetical protein